jgi:RNA polymerase sigma-70 factor (ECF subfamily)
MDRANPGSRLSQISTLWSVVYQAREGQAEARTARKQLAARYDPAIRRYLLGALQDEDAANELAQEFALRFLSGELSGANMSEGRFRFFVKGAVLHLIADYYRRQKKEANFAERGVDVDALAEKPMSCEAFRDNWREEVLRRAWDALARVEQQTGQRLYSVLSFRVEHPTLSSQQMAEQLTEQLGKPVTAAGVRQSLHRARDKFADLLLAEVAQTLRAPTRADLEQELSDLQLMQYCGAALERLRD